ncbi:hypothetical protein F2Q69_00037838 [Brassica cretica]|uniref:Uncharacterized protein n=1 Tax=Brassica cretica TaxID=69181 RepID=A0A8S9SFJ1_BRACR|nr:hypothetical protein F2Q69_00037838 [Brassica cretica]
MKWVRYGLRETASKGRRECMDSCRIDVSEELCRYELGSSSVATNQAWLELGRYVETERDARSVAIRAWSLRIDRAVCMCGNCVVTELGLSMFRSSHSNLSVAGLDKFLLPWDSLCLIQTGFEQVCKLAGFLKTLEYWQRDKFWDLVSRFLILCLEMLETSALGLGQDLGLLLVLEGAMTNSTYISRFCFIMIPYRFKVRDRFSAYATCMVGTEHLSKDNF